MKLPSTEVVSELFLIDPKLGSVVWVKPPKNHPRMIGREAGSPRSHHSGKRYQIIKVGYTPIRRGHLIFFYVHGRWPSPCLDHRNGNSLDDRIKNLREATVTQNAWNHKKRAKVSPLPMGVRTTAAGRYQARIAVNRQTLYLGAFDTASEAHAIYLAKRQELFGVWA